MSYATQDDIEERYPGALEQAGPRDADGNLDEDAIARALTFADGCIDEALAQASYGYSEPYPDWLVDTAVDIALYRVTPAAVLPSFVDRKDRADAALARLRRLASREALPATPPDDLPGGASVTFQSKPRRGWGER